MHPSDYSDLRSASIAGKNRGDAPSPDQNVPAKSDAQSHPGAPRAPPVIDWFPGGFDGYLSPREAQKISNYSRTSLWRLERLGLFPRRRKIGPGRVAYLRSEVLQWCQSREVV